MLTLAFKYFTLKQKAARKRLFQTGTAKPLKEASIRAHLLDSGQIQEKPGRERDSFSQALNLRMTGIGKGRDLREK